MSQKVFRSVEWLRITGLQWTAQVLRINLLFALVTVRNNLAVVFKVIAFVKALRKGLALRVR